MSASGALRPTLEPGVFAGLPQAIRMLFDGEQRQAMPGFTLALHSVDPEGRVHSSLLGLAEIWAPPRLAPASPDQLRLVLWPAARSVANLTRTSRAALACVLDASFVQIQLCAVQRLPDAMGLARFCCEIERVEAQRVAYAHLRSGITFELDDVSGEVEARWAAQLAALRA